MKIVAQRGEHYYLVIEDDSKEEPHEDGRILDAEEEALYPPMKLAAILSRGYWEEYTGSQEILDDLLEDVEVVENSNDVVTGKDS